MTVAAAGGMLALALRDWRLPVYGLLLYLPFSGLPILALYPDTALAVLFKDLVFVLPAYLGFLVYGVRHRLRIVPPGAPIALVAMLATLVLLQALNPALPNRLVAAIGIKVWLFYIPLFALGYYLVRDRRDVVRVVSVAALAGVLPALVGVTEALLFRAGLSDEVYRLYGDAAAAATNNKEALELPGGGVIRRVPSTFSSWTQYFGFTLVMTALAYAWWRLQRDRPGGNVLGAALWLLMVVAAFSSGSRSAFIYVPLLLATAVLLERGISRAAAPILIAPVAALAVSFLLLGAGGSSLLGGIGSKIRTELGGTFIGRFGDALDVTVAGLGTGIDTIASRYAFSRPDEFFAAEGSWYESWYVKVVLELGLVGLVLVVALFGTILVRALRAHRTLGDAGLKAVSAAIIGFIVVNLVLATGKPYLDYDPINVLFWFLAGLQLRITRLDAEAPDP